MFNKTREKIIQLNSKNIKIKPWNNLTLVNFEGIYENNKSFDNIEEFLIIPFIEYDKNLTLIEKRILLIELYKFSKSNNMNIEYFCDSCENRSSWIIDLEKDIKKKELSSRTIKTNNYIFNLRKNSNYCIDYNSNEINTETLKYISSFIESIENEKENFTPKDTEEMKNVLLNDLENKDFEELISKFKQIQPELEIRFSTTCEHCGNKKEHYYKGIEKFLKY